MSYKVVNQSAPPSDERVLAPAEETIFAKPLAALTKASELTGTMLNKQLARSMVDYSARMSGPQNPASWLECFASGWKANPIQLKLNDWASFQQELDRLARASVPLRERHKVANAWVASSSRAADELEQRLEGLDSHNGCVLGIGGGQALCLHYHAEDIAVGHVLKALELKGAELDDVSRAHLGRFEEYAARELPVPAVDTAFELVGHFCKAPCWGRELRGLEQLHAQSHRWDIESAEFRDLPPLER